MVFDCNLFQLVSQPTHIEGNTLDLVLTTEPAVIDVLRVHPALTVLWVRITSCSVLACREILSVAVLSVCDTCCCGRLLQGQLGSTMQLSPGPGLQHMLWRLNCRIDLVWDQASCHVDYEYLYSQSAPKEALVSQMVFTSPTSSIQVLEYPK